jgi:dGTP triphosphohydrolase
MPAVLDWGSIADWVVAATAIVGVRIGIVQLRAVRKAEEQSAIANKQSALAHEQSVEIARANLLRQIDSEFESEDMYRSRKAIRAMRNRSEQTVRKEHMTASDERISTLSAIEFSKQLSELWQEAKDFDDLDVDSPKSQDRIAADRYTEIMRLPNWFETMGLMIRRKLLPKNDILEIYDAAINPTMVYMAEHIRKRRSEGPYVNPHFLEHSMWLGEITKAYTDSKKAPIVKPVANSNPAFD